MNESAWDKSHKKCGQVHISSATDKAASFKNLSMASMKNQIFRKENKRKQCKVN
jgi:hypothetical protein